MVCNTARMEGKWLFLFLMFCLFFGFVVCVVCVVLIKDTITIEMGVYNRCNTYGNVCVWLLLLLGGKSDCKVRGDF